jgi:hypothetical protein
MPSLFRSTILTATLTAALGSAAFAPSAFAQGYPPLPPPRVEVLPPPPGARYIWQPGHWVWNGRAYAWIGGRYIIRRAAYREYVPGHWADRYGRPVWVQPYWR